MKRKILVFDDQPDFGKLLQRVLPAYEVRQESNSSSALESASFYRPDLFILDVWMPGAYGVELAKLIRLFSFFEHTPILFLSASFEVLEEPVRFHGFPAFGKNPFDVVSLRRHIATEFDEKKQEAVPEAMA